MLRDIAPRGCAPRSAHHQFTCRGRTTPFPTRLRPVATATNSSDRDEDQAADSPSTSASCINSSSRRSLIGAVLASAAAATIAPLKARSEETILQTSSAANEVAGVGSADATAITHTVTLTIGIADRALKAAGDRTIGDKSIIPPAPAVGKVVIGLYGNSAPGTVANFLRLVESGSLVGTIFSRVLPGQYIMAGKQGARRVGLLDPPKDIQSNPDILTASSFALPHYRPGTVSLAIGENDDEPGIQQRPNYTCLDFLITTGPGPVPRLNGSNIVFGRVLEGMATVNAVTAVPTFGPSPVGNGLAFNALANALGDERAGTVRRKYGKPLKAVVILDAQAVPA